MPTTSWFFGTFVTFLTVFLWTASQCQGQSDHPNLQISQTRLADGTDSHQVVGVATIQKQHNYTFKCEKLDGPSGNLRWEYVNEPKRPLQMSLLSSGAMLTLNNVTNKSEGLYRCKDGSSSEVEDLLISLFNPSVAPVKSSVSLLENDTLRLAVYSSGHPLPTPERHVWTLNGDRVPNSTTSQDGKKFTVPSVQFQRDSRYACRVGVLTGGRFAHNSTSFTVTVYVPPKFIDSPESATVDEFSNVTLECRASGNPVPNITWNRDGGTVEQQEELLDSGLPVVRSTYTISRVRYSAQGIYKCTATIPAAELGPSELTSVSQEASLMVHPILLLKHRVGNGELQATENVIFITDNRSEVVVSCFGSLTLEWVGPSGTAVSMSSNDTVHQMYDSIADAQRLIISSFTFQYSGNYTCRSSGANREKSILITMNNPAVFPVKPMVYASQGSNATLSVTVTGTPTPTEDNISWYFEEKPLHPFRPGSRHSFAPSNRELTIASVETGDYGMYMCEVNTTAGTARATITLAKLVHPTASVLPSSVKTVVGQEVKASCTGSGSGQLIITWTKNGTAGLPAGAMATPDGNLTIKSTSLAHNGSYTCVVMSEASPDYAHYAHLEVIVQVPPEIRIEFGNPATEINNVTNLVFSEEAGHEILCFATGSPPPKLSWHYNGEKVRAEDVAGTNPLRLTWDGTLSSNHSGQYSCRAENEVATVTKSFTLTVRAPTPFPESDVHVQLRILTEDCTEWNSEQLSLARTSVSSVVYNSTLASCGCSFGISQFTSFSLVCSYVVPGAVSFRATILSSSEVPASIVYAAFSSWARSSPTVVILGVQAQVDSSCNPFAASETSPECPSVNASALPFELWVLVVICVVGAVGLLVIVVGMVSCCCYCCCCRKKGVYNIYSKNIRSDSFQARSLPRESDEAAQEHSYMVDNSGEVDGRNHTYDEPSVSVRWSSSNQQSTGGVIRIGSSSENSNAEGYSMLHPDDEEDQNISPVVTPVQQTQFPPQHFTNRSLMSGITASSFTQVTIVPSVQSSESGLYAEVQDNDRKVSMQGDTPNVSSPPINGAGGTQRQTGGWYNEGGADNPTPAYSLSQPIYHIPKEPVPYMDPSPWRRTATQLQNGHMTPHLPPGLRTALV